MIQGLRNLIFDIFPSHVFEQINRRLVRSCLLPCCLKLDSPVIFLEKFLTSLVSKFQSGRVISFSIYTFFKFSYEAGDTFSVLVRRLL